ncbi:ejaculatory bulb-specific protein 3-like [Neodiprion pinetum]|uniref:Ejaculatory bulb-specific protein 3 n=1 Tax=Neodiprion lecontei TaxID=441921 RepID=A0A6J0BN27_NEOLC|nr:ejaculatory bulb-specific protein 3 [Neodiprion lecontei]XP_046477037.1 ejaculatory bulb-specific protein 3-like [Neodiprion pinetum]
MLNIMSTLSTMLRITFIAGFAVVFLAMAATEELYSDKNDNITVLELLQNEPTRKQYYECFLGTGPCVTADAEFFKEHLPEAVLMGCRKCTEKQKMDFDTMTVWYIENKPDEWQTLIRKLTQDAQNIKIEKSHLLNEGDDRGCPRGIDPR